MRNIAQLLVVIHLPEDHNPMLFGSAVQYCYHVMGLVHAKWAPIPGAIKVGQMPTAVVPNCPHET